MVCKLYDTHLINHHINIAYLRHAFKTFAFIPRISSGATNMLLLRSNALVQILFLRSDRLRSRKSGQAVLTDVPTVQSNMQLQRHTGNMKVCPMVRPGRSDQLLQYKSAPRQRTKPFSGSSTTQGKIHSSTTVWFIKNLLRNLLHLILPFRGS